MNSISSVAPLSLNLLASSSSISISALFIVSNVDADADTNCYVIGRSNKFSLNTDNLIKKQKTSQTSEQRM